MDLTEFTIELLKDFPAVGTPQIKDLVYLGNSLCSDLISPEIVIEMFVSHMQKYYGFST